MFKQGDTLYRFRNGKVETATYEEPTAHDLCHFDAPNVWQSLVVCNGHRIFNDGDWYTSEQEAFDAGIRLIEEQLAEVKQEMAQLEANLEALNRWRATA